MCRNIPEWFRQRPDGTIQYAENPPKKYQDIYPFNFDTDYWEELWQELKSVITFWMDQVRIFQVDNPLQPIPFWEWVIAPLNKKYSDIIFFVEGLLRPEGHGIAGQGRLYTKSYTYFTFGV